MAERVQRESLALPSSMPELEQSQRLRLNSSIIGVGSLAMASIEAVCTFFVALSKLGILVGFTSFLSTVIVSRYHADQIRVPVLAAAFAGAVINLLVLWNRRRLRNRPSAAWRTRPLSAHQRWRSKLLITVSSVTVLLILAEFWIHPIRGL